MSTKVVVVDSHPIVHTGLVQILNNTPGMRVVGCASCSASGCRMIEEEHPDVVILDAELGGASALEVLRQFRNRFPQLPGIVFTASTERHLVVEALKQRMQGFVIKSSEVDHLIKAIHSVASGRPYFDPEVSSALVAGYEGTGKRKTEAELSGRQMGVLRLLAEGLSNKEIARDLFITESTVKFHVSAILQVLNARNRAHAVRIAEQEGWIRPHARSGSRLGMVQFAR